MSSKPRGKSECKIKGRADKHSEVPAPGEPELFNTQCELKRSAKRLFHGDLYVLGRIWIKSLQTWLVGVKFRLVKECMPVVEAAKPDKDVPQRPNPMRASDLPLYGSPHVDYKEYAEEKSLCPDVNVKLAQRFLNPYVSYGRQCAQGIKAGVKNEIKETRDEISWFLEDKKKAILKDMRCPKNINERYATVAVGGLAGFLYARKMGKPSKFFYSGLGVLATGALCFPEDTDKYFKALCYHSTKSLIAVYNWNCSKSFSFRERLPCKDELPKVDPKKTAIKPNPCPIPDRK